MTLNVTEAEQELCVLIVLKQNKVQHFSESGRKSVFGVACKTLRGKESASTSLMGGRGGCRNLLMKRLLQQKKMAVGMYADNLENNAKG